MYCDLSHDYCVIEVDDHRREFCYFGDDLYLHKLVYTSKKNLNSDVGFMFDQYLQQKPSYLLLKYYQEGAGSCRRTAS